jgi:hypothetical protein
MNDFLKNIVPMLGTAISTVNPLAGLAVAAVGKALGIETNDRKDIEKALQNATPEQLVALKKAEQEFSIKMAELGYNNVKDLEAIAAGDRDSARKREIATNDLTPRFLAGVIVISYVAVQFVILTAVIDASMRDLALRSLGVLDTSLGLVLSYYFGSSSSSRRKDETIGDLQRGKM